MKDRNDELTVEVEDLKHQLSSTRRQKRASRSNNADNAPSRQGSLLSDYVKPSKPLRRAPSPGQMFTQVIQASLQFVNISE